MMAKVGQTLLSIFRYATPLLGEVFRYLGRSCLDLVSGARLVLLWRARRRSPERAGEYDRQIDALRQQRAARWAQWRTLPTRRHSEVRLASLLVAAATVWAAPHYVSGPGDVSQSSSQRGGKGQPTSTAPKGQEASSKKPAEDFTRFLKVKEWAGTFEVKLEGAGSCKYQDSSWESVKVRFSAQGTCRFTSKRDVDTVKGWQWVGGGNISVDYEGEDESGGEHRRIDSKARAKSHGLLDPGSYLEVELAEGERHKKNTYWLYLWNSHAVGERWSFEWVKKTIINEPRVESGTQDGNLGVMISNIPLPASGLRLKGSRQIPLKGDPNLGRQFPEDFYEMNVEGNLFVVLRESGQEKPNVTVSWDLSPAGSHYSGGHY